MKAIFAIVFAAGLVGVMSTPVQEVRYVKGPNQCQEDPLIVPPGTFNLTLHPLFNLAEESNHGGLVVAGVSGLITDISIIIITLTLNFRVEVPSIEADATSIDVLGYVDTRPFTALPVGNYTGTTTGTTSGIARVRNLRVEGSATLFVNIIGNRVSVRVLTVGVFSFDEICLNLGANFQIGGNPVDWTDFCANFKGRFDAEWGNTQLKNQLVEKIRVAANVIVGRYTLDELIDLIGGGDGPTSAPCPPA
jgi:hypothetical protein